MAIMTPREIDLNRILSTEFLDQSSREIQREIGARYISPELGKRFIRYKYTSRVKKRLSEITTPAIISRRIRRMGISPKAGRIFSRIAPIASKIGPHILGYAEKRIIPEAVKFGGIILPGIGMIVGEVPTKLNFGNAELVKKIFYSHEAIEYNFLKSGIINRYMSHIDPGVIFKEAEAIGLTGNKNIYKKFLKLRKAEDALGRYFRILPKISNVFAGEKVASATEALISKFGFNIPSGFTRKKLIEGYKSSFEKGYTRYKANLSEPTVEAISNIFTKNTKVKLLENKTAGLVTNVMHKSKIGHNYGTAAQKGLKTINKAIKRAAKTMLRMR